MQSNVQDVRDFILARCSTMNNGFIPCYPDLSGPFNVTIEIVGIGEVEMSDNLIINETNTLRYIVGLVVEIPFEVKKVELFNIGKFYHLELIYMIQLLILIELQGDVTVRQFLFHPLLPEI